MGFQEPAPRYESRRQGIAPIWWVVLAVFAMVAWVWIDKQADPDSARGLSR